MARKVRDGDIDHAVQLYRDGMTIAAAAETGNVGSNRLAHTIRERGVRRSDRESRMLGEAQRCASYMARAGVDTSTIVARYLDGESEYSIARSLGVSREVVKRRLIDAGVRRRDLVAANRLMMATRTPEENRRNVAAAHAAIAAKRAEWRNKLSVAHRERGGPDWDAQCKAAITRERRQLNISPAETLIQVWLAQRGIEVTAQKAVGPYNVDLAVESVAVEVFGGGWHAHGEHSRRAPKRLSYILDEGWHLVIIWANIQRAPLREAAADQIVAALDAARGNPALRGQYRVIWGDGEPAAVGGHDLDELTRVPPRSRRD